MTMILPTLGGSPFPERPYSNVTAFTARDGSTYLEVLEQLRSYIRDTLVPHFNAQYGNLSEDWLKNILDLNNSIAEQLQVQDSKIEGQFEDQDSKIALQLESQNTEIDGKILEFLQEFTTQIGRAHV